MNALHALKRKLHQRALAKQLRQLNNRHLSVDFESAKSIGILFDGTELGPREQILSYAKQLKSRGKKVKLLAFMNNRQENEGFVFKSFNKKELDFFLRPKSEEVREFIETPFDILLNLTPQPVLPLEYIAAVSKALFRVSRYHEQSEAYEMMVDLPENADIKELIKQIEFFLNKMQRTNEAAAV
jgi:hypothetical protein